MGWSRIDQNGSLYQCVLTLALVEECCVCVLHFYLKIEGGAEALVNFDQIQI